MEMSEREEFARLLLADLLRVVGSAGLLRSSYVVSPDADMLALASRIGSQTVEEPRDMGVNAAVARGLGVVPGAGSVLVIPADLPLLKRSELLHLVGSAADGRGLTIAPSKAFDGTNALMFPRSARLSLSYDRDSFWNHLSGAAREGLPVRVCTEPGLMFDVDAPGDFEELALSRSGRPSAEFARRAAR